MLKQHHVDKLFGSLVYAVHMARASVAQSPMMGFAVLAGVSISIAPVVQPLVESIASSEMAGQAKQSVRASLNAVELSLRALAPEPERDLTGLGLSAPQLRLASFAAKKYRVALADTQKYVALAFESAAEQRVDPMLVLAVMAIESNFKPSAQSHVGAQGLMQVHLVAHKAKFEPFGGKHMAFDPAVNIQVGVQILKDYLRRTSSYEMALKFYVGAANHENDGGYAFKVLSERERLIAAAAGRSVPASPLKTPAWLLAKISPAKQVANELPQGAAMPSAEGRSNGSDEQLAPFSNSRGLGGRDAGSTTASEPVVPSILEEKGRDERVSSELSPSVIAGKT